MFDRPAAGRAFFEGLIRDHLDLGRPGQVPLTFGRRVTARTPGAFRTQVITRGAGPQVTCYCKSSRLRQYFNCDMKSHAVSEYVDWRFGVMLKT